MRKIAFFLPDLRCGGAEKVALLLANEFIKQGFKVDMVLSKAQGEFLLELNSQIRIVDLKADRIRYVFKPLLKYFKSEKPDVVLASMWPLTLLAVVAFKSAKLPGSVIVSDHTTFSQAPLMQKRSMRWFFKYSLSLVYPFANAIVTVTDGVADDLCGLGGLKRKSITVIFNPVELNTDLCPEDEGFRHWKNYKGKKIIAVGALKKEKDYPALLEAFSLLIKKEDAYLTILGQGDLLADLKALAVKLEIAERVNFAGFSRNPSAWMASSDLLVLSSNCEGFGNVLIEAMSVGRPVVSTDCQSGPREILENERYGRLVPVGDIRALANAMYKSLNDQHNINALKSRAADFSVDKIAKQYIEAFK